MDDAAKEPKKTFNCYSCGIDCTRSRFHYAKTDQSNQNTAAETKYDLCPNCFLQGRLPSSHSASDFVKLEEPSYTTIPDKDAPWTDSELLLLLEGLEQHDDNWGKIAEHVGTRTREDCVMKFLQLEISDNYLNDEPEFDSNTMRQLNLNGRQPVSQLENPVMSVVAFLTQMAQPAVVAAAAGKSVDVMRQELRASIEKGVTVGPEKGKEKEPLKPEEDAMDVEPQPSQNAEPVPQTPEASLAAVALSSSAARAAALASHEEREMTRLVGAAVNITLQKFELKLAQFNEMESVVQAERRDLERARQQLFIERMGFRRKVRELDERLAEARNRGGEDGVRMAMEALSIGKSQSFGVVNSGEKEDGGMAVDGDVQGEDLKKWEI